MSSTTVEAVTETFGSLEPLYAGEPLPKGRYLLEVYEAVVKHAKGDDFPYVEYKVTVLDGEYAKRKVTDRLYLRTEKPDGSGPSEALRMTFASLNIMFGGSVPDDILSKSKYDAEALAEAIANNIVGQQFEAYVTIEKDKSETYGDKNRIEARRLGKR